MLQIKNQSLRPFQVHVAQSGGQVFKPAEAWRSFVKRSASSARPGEFKDNTRLMLDQCGFFLLADRMKMLPTGSSVKQAVEQNQWMTQLRPANHNIAYLNNREDWQSFGLPAWHKSAE